MAFGRRFDFYPALRYDASKGIWQASDRVQRDNGAWDYEVRPVHHMRFIADLKNVGVGHLRIEKGEQPQLLMAPASADADPPSPGAGWRRAFRLLGVLGGETFVREVTSDSRLLWDAFDQVHSQFVVETPHHPEELPIIESLQAIADGKLHRPTIEIVDWVKRPTLLPDRPPASITTALPSRNAREFSASSNASKTCSASTLEDEIPF